MKNPVLYLIHDRVAEAGMSRRSPNITLNYMDMTTSDYLIEVQRLKDSISFMNDTM
jgi:hypothetical protein